MVKKINEEGFENIFRRGRESDRLFPDNQIWERLEDKLDSHTNKKNSFVYRRWAIAASVVMLISLGLSFGFFLSSNKSAFFASGKDQSPILMEELDISNPSGISLAKLNELNKAYQRLESKNEIIERIN